MTSTILVGDCVESMRTLPDGCVQCCVTSPPYHGLRDYGVTGQIGLEETLDEFIAKLVAVFREVRRVLRDDGTIWVNMGDGYSANVKTTGRNDADRPHGTEPRGTYNVESGPRSTVKVNSSIPPKNLIGQPWRLAFALQADGWILRSDVIWHKPNPMPESVTDRPTKSHEYVFLLTKKPRYFYDAEAVRERSLKPCDPERYAKILESTPEAWYQRKDNPFSDRKSGDKVGGISPPGGRNLRTVWTISTESLSGAVVHGRNRTTSPDCPVHGYRDGQIPAPAGDEQLSASPSAHNHGIDDHPAQSPEAAGPSIPEGPGERPADSRVATSHSRRKNKTDFGSVPGGSADVGSSSRTEYTELPGRSCIAANGNSENRTSVGSVSGETGTGHGGQTDDGNAHKSTVWTLDETPIDCTCYYTGNTAKKIDHFASFPRKLVEPCLKAGTSAKGCCPECGAPWGRVVEKTSSTPGQMPGYTRDCTKRRDGERAVCWVDGSTKTIGWDPTCDCDYKYSGGKPRRDIYLGPAPVPCTVLDPFAGAGTTGVVAKGMGLNFIGCELNPEYAEMARRRIANPEPMLTPVDVPGQMEMFA